MGEHVPVAVKICGLTTRETVLAAVGGGARFIGFVFFPPSPRFLSAGAASALTHLVPAGVGKVGLVVDATDDELSAVVSASGIDTLQLHGSESPERVDEIRRRFGLPTIKAVPIRDGDDLETAAGYEDVSDWLLFDAAPPRGASRPGGLARTFDWSVLRRRRWRRPWILAGGLHAGNVAEAVRVSGAPAVDVSSGVEVREGVKSVERIREFLRAAGRAGGGVAPTDARGQ